MSPCKNRRSPGLHPRTSAIMSRFDLTAHTNALILMLFSIDNDHGVLNCTRKLILVGTTQCHVSDEIGDHAHFALLVFFLHQPDIVRIAFRNCISCLGIESFQCFQCTGGLDVDLVGNRNRHNRVTIEVCARKPLCNLRINADCILNCTEIPLAADILVVDSHDGNLKGTCMGITDQCKPGAILIGGAVSLCLLNLIDRQDNLRGLARESRCFAFVVARPVSMAVATTPTDAATARMVPPCLRRNFAHVFVSFIVRPPF